MSWQRVPALCRWKRLYNVPSALTKTVVFPDISSRPRSNTNNKSSAPKHICRSEDSHNLNHSYLYLKMIEQNAGYLQSILAEHNVCSVQPRLTEEDTERLNYATALAKGQKLLALLYNSAVEQSPYVSSEDLTTWGYHTRALNLPGIGGLSPSVLDLGIHTEGNDFTIITTEHTHDVTIDGKCIPATEAEFSSTINTRAGLICAEYSFGPAYCANRTEWDAGVPLPNLKHWSDVAFLQWSSLKRTAPGELKYVLRSRISEKDTLAVIAELVANLSDEYRYLGWPGISFDMARSDHAKALLGTPNGSGVAWLLAQHRSQLGWKDVSEVRLFYSAEPLDCPCYRSVSLLFYIRDVGKKDDQARYSLVV
jgi:hypothetical protein